MMMDDFQLTMADQGILEPDAISSSELLNKVVIKRGLCYLKSQMHVSRTPNFEIASLFLTQHCRTPDLIISLSAQSFKLRLFPILDLLHS